MLELALALTALLLVAISASFARNPTNAEYKVRDCSGVVDFVITDSDPAGGLLKVVATILISEDAAGRLFSRIKGVK